MIIKNIAKVAGTMPVKDPFILSAYHYDLYPKANGKMGPDASLEKHNLGNDFNNPDGWNMYYGQEVPGFPHHPHRGFEIVTIAEEGYADHFDSKGSKGRYGNGDVQLMSAGSGVLHGEMFPLLNEEGPNPLRLFQIWLNLPAKNKLTDADYKMLWNEKIPRANVTDDNGRSINIKVILGEYYGVKSIDPLINSWATDPNNHVGIALVDLDSNAEFKLNPVSDSLYRSVFFFNGKGLISIDNVNIQERHIADLDGNQEIIIKNGDQKARLLILEGEPIKEPVAAHGPFVMNTQQELHDAFAEYRRTQFGGWPWGEKESDLINPKESGRFASYNFDKEIDKP